MLIYDEVNYIHIYNASPFYHLSYFSIVKILVSRPLYLVSPWLSMLNRCWNNLRHAGIFY